MERTLGKRRSTFTNIEFVLIFLLLFSFSGAAYQFPLIAQVSRLISYPILLFLIAIRYKDFIFFLRKDIFLVCLIFLALISVNWSISPELTAAHSRGLVRSTLLGVYLAIRYRLKDQLHIYASVFAVCIFLSLFFGVLLPSSGVHTEGPHIGLWQGTFSHKNVLGRIMNVSAQVFLLLSINEHLGYRKILFSSGLLASILLIILSGSVTALGTLTVLAFLLPIYQLLKNRNYKLKIIFSVISVLIVTLAATGVLLSLETIVTSQGKDMTFNGRTNLWPLLIQEFSTQKLFLGYGYQAFWDQYAYLVSRIEGWDITHAHNGFIELLLGLGIVGIILYFLSFIPAFTKAIIQMNSATTPLEYWPIQLFTLVLIVDFSVEATIISSTNIIWILFVSAVLSFGHKGVYY